MKLRQVGKLSLILVGVSACTNPALRVANPADIALDKALLDVANGLSGLKTAVDANPNNPMRGSLVDEVDVTFALAATGTRQDGVTGTVGAPAGAPVNVSLGVSLQDTATGSRGSSITIKIRNAATAPLNYVGCYYYIQADYGSTAAKGCSAQKADAPKAGGGGQSMNDGQDAIAKYAANRLQHYLRDRDSGFVVQDAALH